VRTVLAAAEGRSLQLALYDIATEHLHNMFVRCAYVLCKEHGTEP
jgi:hypothetical protein